MVWSARPASSTCTLKINFLRNTCPLCKYEVCIRFVPVVLSVVRLQVQRLQVSGATFGRATKSAAVALTALSLCNYLRCQLRSSLEVAENAHLQHYTYSIHFHIMLRFPFMNSSKDPSLYYNVLFYYIDSYKNHTYTLQQLHYRV